MKIGKILMIIVALALIILFSMLHAKKAGYDKAAKEYQYIIDTIMEVCSQVPDTVVKRDTIWNEKTVFKEVYKPIPAEVGEVYEYKDTVVTDDLEFYINDRTRGMILSRQTGYKLKVPLIIKDTVTIFKQVPQLIEVPKYTELEYKAYLQAQIGFDYYSIGYGRIIKNRHAFGVNAVYFRQTPYATISYAYLFSN